MSVPAGSQSAHPSRDSQSDAASAELENATDATTAAAATSARGSADRSAVNHLIRFAIVGVGSTILYTVLFALLDMRLNHHVANVSALVFCTVLNTWVNQRFTFDAAGHQGTRSAHIQSLVILAMTLAVTTLALVLEHHFWPGASTLWDTITVTVGNAIATVIRFVVFRKIFTS